MAIIFRTAGAWGAGKGSNLTPLEVDGNFWDHEERIDDLEALPAAAAGIDYFTIVGDQLTVVMTDATTRGPYTLPVSIPQFEGEWAASTSYSPNDIITNGGSAYVVLKSHISALTFDPGASDTDGDIYGLLLTNPASVLPAGGAAGQALVKTSGADYAATWTFTGLLPTGGTARQFLLKNSSTDYDADFDDAVLEDISDVEYPTAGPSVGDSLIFDGDNWVPGTPTLSLTASEIAFEPFTDNPATDVQGAIEALVVESLQVAANLFDLEDATEARVNLGVEIGVDVQAYDAQLSSLVQQNSQSAAYTTVLTDSGKHIFHPAADTTTRVFTIDSDANVPYPIGTVLTFVNENSGGVITIAITSDTMRLAGAGSTGSRTLAANGIATALKITSTSWLISGTGLT